MATQSPAAPTPVPEQNVKDRFFRHFQEEVTDIQNRIAGLDKLSTAGGERTDAMEHCLASITALSNEVSDLSGIIASYDQRLYTQALKALQDKFDEARDRITPRRKFQFKTAHKNGSAISINDAVELANQQRLQAPGAKLDPSSNESSNITTPANFKTPPNEDVLGDLPKFQKNYNEEMAQLAAGRIRKPSFSQAATIDISGHKDIHIILPTTASRATSAGSLTKLNRCIVDLSEPTAHGTPFAGLTLKNIKDSLIVAGHVAGAAHITDVKDSIILVASRQVRMHNCTNVDVYLHCASRPIIEDCKNVRFSPIPECHKTSTEEPVQNQWDQVDDFKWLKSEPSPNWSILPPDSRLKEDVWKNVVPGGPGVGLEDIFKQIGLPAR